MIAFQQILLALNVLLTLVFGLDYFVFGSPKVAPKAKARAGVLTAILFLAFLVLLLVFAVARVAVGRSPLHLALALYVIVPFAIGRLVSYRTLRFYTVLQELAFLLSAVTLSVI